MLSYRHAFHAGNHADVLKHMALVQALRYMTGKDKSLCYIDTHAGAGAYSLQRDYAAQNREWESGYAAIAGLGRTGMPAAVAEYLDAVAAFRVASGRDDAYPGSPALTLSILRPSDRAELFELHPADYELLSKACLGDRRARVHKSDGPRSLGGILPPPSRRGLTLIDPSYELASDYDDAVECVRAGLRLFETGVYMLWYPILDRAEARELPGRVLAVSKRPCLHLSLLVRKPVSGQRGMFGSGLLVYNPPWTMAEAMRVALPWLCEKLAPKSASWNAEMRD